MTKTLYGNGYFSLADLEPYYSLHVSAMTTEGLHSKSDIAGELAVRDKTIADLHAALDRANAIIGQEADKAKRLSDEVERLDALVVGFDRRIENMTRPCPNHPRVRLAPDEGCAVCANST